MACGPELLATILLLVVFVPLLAFFLESETVYELVLLQLSVALFDIRGVLVDRVSDG